MSDQKQKSIADDKILKNEAAISFSKENTKLIQEMIGTFGVDEEDVVINALKVLYGVFKGCPDAKTVVAQNSSGDRAVIRLPVA